MDFFRKIDKRILIAWTVLLSLLMLSAQGVTLHVHSFDHDSHQGHHSIDNINGHSHIGGAHLSLDSSHQDHHDETTTVIDACPDCLKQVASNLLMAALIGIVLFLPVPGLYRNKFPINRGNVSLPRRFHLIPPLRAPPL